MHDLGKPYECTFCGRKFDSKNEFERHNNSLHSYRQTWSCAGVLSSSEALARISKIISVCLYCGTNFPAYLTDDSLQTHLDRDHRFNECNKAKKFFRIDHFRQHLKYSHGACTGWWTEGLDALCRSDEPLSQRRVSSTHDCDTSREALPELAHYRISAQVFDLPKDLEDMTTLQPTTTGLSEPFEPASFLLCPSPASWQEQDENNHPPASESNGWFGRQIVRRLMMGRQANIENASTLSLTLLRHLSSLAGEPPSQRPGTEATPGHDDAYSAPSSTQCHTLYDAQQPSRYDFSTADVDRWAASNQYTSDLSDQGLESSVRVSGLSKVYPSPTDPDRPPELSVAAQPHRIEDIMPFSFVVTVTTPAPKVHKALFVCSTCQRSFTRRTILVNHERTHTGEKPFSCSLDGCGKTFAQQGDKTRHEQAQHAEKTFRCGSLRNASPSWGCGKTFRRKDGLLEHHSKTKKGRQCLADRDKLLGPDRVGNEDSLGFG
jgi:hypothetical protein